MSLPHQMEKEAVVPSLAPHQTSMRILQVFFPIMMAALT